MKLRHRVFELLMRGYPRSFREQYREQLLDTFEDAWQRERGVRFWVRVCLDGLVNGVSARLRTRRTERRPAVLDLLWSDVRGSAVVLRRSPAYSAITIATIALSIALTATVFSLAHDVLLEQRPFTEAERVAQVENAPVALGPSFEFRVAKLLREHPAVESASLYYAEGAGNLELPTGAVQVAVSQVDDAFLSTLGVRPLLGLDGRALPEGEAALWLSYRGWRRWFGGDPSIVGMQARMNGRSLRIAGVLPPSAEFPATTDVWTRLPFEWEFVTGAAAPDVIIRTRPGLAAAQAAARIEAAARADRPDNTPARVIPLHEVLTGAARRPLLLLIAAVGVLLLAGCANIAGLMLARVTARRDEFQTRAALGGTRSRVFRTVLAEALCLAALGAAIGIILALPMLQWLVERFPAGVLTIGVVQLNWAATTVATTVAIITTLAFGTIPALRAVRLSQYAGRATGIGGTPVRQRTWRTLLVFQVAMAVLLVFGAGLLGRTMQQLLSEPLGFDGDGVLTYQVQLPATTFEPEHRRAYLERTLEQLRALPGASAVAAGTRAPFTAGMGYGFPIASDHATLDDLGNIPGSVSVTPDYFRTLGIPILRGRTLEGGEVVLSERVARGLFGARDPIGAIVRVGADSRARSYTVAGVVGEARYRELHEADGGKIYLPLVDDVTPFLSFVMATSASERAALAAVRNAIRTIDPTVAPQNLRAMRMTLQDAAGARPAVLSLLSGLAFVALGLCGLGLYALIAHDVGQRRAELSLRLALGATPGSLLTDALVRALGVACAGVVIGLLLTVPAGRLLTALLFGVDSFDSLTLSLVAAVVFTLAGVATLIPALRVLRIQPMNVLRE